MPRFMTDEYIDEMLPLTPEELVEDVHKKQYRFARAGVEKLLREQREMLLPLGEDAVKAVVAGLKMYLLNFAAAKLGKLRKVEPKPKVAKTQPPVPPVTPPVEAEEKTPETPTGK